MTLTPYNDQLWLGLMTVTEWAKDNSEQVGPLEPSFQRDTTNIYLVTSRDGIHLDDSWVYGHRPLIPKGAKQCNWNCEFLLHADQIVAAQKQQRVYFEARPAAEFDTRRG